MVSLETLQLGESRDEEPWKVGTKKHIVTILAFDLEITWKDQTFLSIFRRKKLEQKRRVVRCTVHGVLGVGEELRQRPEGIFLVQVHEQDGGDLTHALAVAHLLVKTPVKNRVQL